MRAAPNSLKARLNQKLLAPVPAVAVTACLCSNHYEQQEIQGNVLPLDVATGGSFLLNLLIIKVAEREGFEPPVPCGTPDFESGAIDHSATSP
jgi:hypothetical protein